MSKADQKHYANGRTFEYAVRDALRAVGFAVVRGAGSKGETKADLIGFHPYGAVVLVQCKTNGIISAEEWDTMYEVALWAPTSRALIAYKPSRGKITFDLITGKRIPYKPALNREPYDLYGIHQPALTG